ncbi:hypothetical protein LTR10_012824 [Elasticomyces elasticus]|nr:hypothetical protein LTR10_012824 [Elasticomyces elasticus]KAK4978754.1 hypothetical protein LTR42_001254 [Elasticomyces elasticus]
MDILARVPWTVSAALLCLSALGFLLYRAALPKPIDGIPYNNYAARRILGDVPEMIAYNKRTAEMQSFLTEQLVKLDSPVIQLFLRPFGRPWVVIADFREAHDILARRSREFDRSDFFGDLFVNLLPGNQVHMKTGDGWRFNRRLMADTMSNSFLQNVAAPRIYESTNELLDLWRQKVRLAKGRPFDFKKDVYKAALDMIWAASFGASMGVTRSQLDHVCGIEQLEVPRDIDAAMYIPATADPADFEAVMTLSDSTEIPMKSPMPRWHHWLAMKTTPVLVAARKAKDKMIKDRLNEAWRKFSSPETSDCDVRGACDLLVQREVMLAGKEGRLPEYDTQTIRDELFGFLIAGHETTSTTVCWGLKFLTAYQDVQSKLRSALRAEFRRAVSEGSAPTAEEIARANIPYFDATIEEMLRCGLTAPANMRCATVDTEILGHRIPAGTNVFMMSNGPGFLTKPMHIEEQKRSKSSQESTDKIGIWDVSDIGVFQPERWLKKDEKGATLFDSRSGPALPFGAGPRGCFGSFFILLEHHVS